MISGKMRKLEAASDERDSLKFAPWWLGPMCVLIAFTVVGWSTGWLG